MSDILSKIDEKLLYAANKAVHAYNWVTGGTKSELANGVLSLGLISFAAAGFVTGIPGGIIGSALILKGAHEEQKENIRFDNLEEKTKEKECLNIEVEARKEFLKERIPYQLAVAGVLGVTSVISSFGGQDTPNLEAELVATYGSISMALWSFSDYVMRTNPMPPRKNVFARAKDRLVEIVKSYSRKPEPVHT